MSEGPERSRPAKVLSNRTVAICASVVVTLAGAGAWLLLVGYGGGTRADQVGLEAIRTVGTIVLGAGGAIALLLAARRQQTAERDLIEKQRDLAHKERVAEVSERDATERRITELYTKAAEQLGSDKAPVRLAGLYALERLAQDHPTQRLTITNLVCAYLRMPYVPPPEAPDASTDDYRDLIQEREVRLTAQSILWNHFTKHDEDAYWGPFEIDLTGATLIDFNFSWCRVGVGKFMKARFVGSTFFRETEFTGWANFADAHFGWVIFDRPQFAGEAVFFGASFASSAHFDDIEFSRAAFDGADFAGNATFRRSRFVRAEFHDVRFHADVNFHEAEFIEEEQSSGGPTMPSYVSFDGTTFAQGVPPEIAPWMKQ